MGKSLSMAGRLELILSVLTSYHFFWSSAFTVPKGVIKEMNRHFLWQGSYSERKMHHVNWVEVCKPKLEGGLGLTRISDWNCAFCGVRLWELASNTPSMWADWIRNYYLRKDVIIKHKPPCHLSELPELDSHATHPIKKVLAATILTNYLWFIWLERNNRVFRGMAGQAQPTSINLLEFKGILSSIEMGLHMGAFRLWIESDSSIALAWLKGRGSLPWTALRTHRRITQILDGLHSWKATHIHREGNSVVDLLASHRTSSGESVYRLHDL
ncbi:hypothetical protein QJS10_CPA16g00322 [Acorus calamus]|uniref:RNase H type-1 domain-containing protein n=1 Tax=Acorus calamus TaxID=4465 RepID=A0AAV9CYZ0_ACOCL|nr:hypothetical protein QJS10_CPA16g00322 [Acorus calamus]